MGVELYAPVDRKVDVVVEIFIQFSSNQLLQFGNIFRILFDNTSVKIYRAKS